MRRLSAPSCVLPILALAACSSESAPETNKCSAESTYELVQSVFEIRGCTASTCHGSDESTAAATTRVTSSP